MAWLSSGRITNPIADQVLVDTGQLPQGTMSFMLVGSATVASVFEIQLRNAANTATLKSQILAAPASSTANIPETPVNPPFAIATDERLRVIQVTGITGSVSVSLFYAG